MTFQRELAIKIRGALDYFAEMGITSGDVVDGLRETEEALNSTLAMYVYTTDDLVNVADDVDAKFSEEDAEIFLKAMHAGKTKDFQDTGLSVLRWKNHSRNGTPRYPVRAFCQMRGREYLTPKGLTVPEERKNGLDYSYRKINRTLPRITQDWK